MARAKSALEQKYDLHKLTEEALTEIRKEVESAIKPPQQKIRVQRVAVTVKCSRADARRRARYRKKVKESLRNIAEREGEKEVAIEDEMKAEIELKDPVEEEDQVIVEAMVVSDASTTTAGMSEPEIDDTTAILHRDLPGGAELESEREDEELKTNHHVSSRGGTMADIMVQKKRQHSTSSGNSVSASEAQIANEADTRSDCPAFFGKPYLYRLHHVDNRVEWENRMLRKMVKEKTGWQEQRIDEWLDLTLLEAELRSVTVGSRLNGTEPA